MAKYERQGVRMDLPRRGMMRAVIASIIEPTFIQSVIVSLSINGDIKIAVK